MQAEASQTPSEPSPRTPSEGADLDNPLDAAEAAAITSLKQEWGADWESRLEVARGAVRNMSRNLSYDVEDFLEESRLGSHPTVIKSFYEWSQGRKGPEISPAEAKAILGMMRRSDLYRTGDSRARDTLLNMTQALYSITNPEG